MSLHYKGENKSSTIPATINNDNNNSTSVAKTPFLIVDILYQNNQNNNVSNNSHNINNNKLNSNKNNYKLNSNNNNNTINAIDRNNVERKMNSSSDNIGHPSDGGDYRKNVHSER